MLALFLIGLREGLEASLVVSILIAYLVKTGRRSDVHYIWLGVAAAIALVAVVFTAVTIAFDQLSFTWQKGIGGTLSVLAAALVTWMIFWMRRTARTLERELESEPAGAVALGPSAIFVVAFLTVGREGLETAAIIRSTINSATTSDTFIGVVGGIAVAVVLGIGIYLGAIRIDLGTFFTVTGALLILVAAGVLAYGICDLQEAGILPRLTFDLAGFPTSWAGLGDQVVDISGTLAPDSWLATLLKGTLNVQVESSWLQVIAWTCYVVPVLVLHLRPTRSAAPTSAVPAEA